MYGNASTIRMIALLAQRFYTTLIGTQLTLVMLAAPAATAGAICLDRARGTLAHVLVTDLSDREIVLGKLAARLVPVLGLVGCALPVMAMLTLLGGVDPDALIGAFLMTVGVALIGCSLALVFSLWVGKTHEALLGTYAVFGLWLLARPMLTTLGGALGVSLPIPDRMIDPYYLAFAPYWHPGVVGWWDYVAFLGVMAGLSMALAMVAVWRLRPVCTAHGSRGPARKRGWGWLGRHLPTFARSRRFLVGWLAPSLDFNPVLWREWHRKRGRRGCRGSWWGYVWGAGGVVHVGLRWLQRRGRKPGDPLSGQRRCRSR